MGITENKAAVVAAYEAFGRGDIEAILAANAPDTVWQVHSASKSPLTGDYKGNEEVAAFFGKVGSSIEISKFEMAPVAAEGDVVVAAGVQEYTVTSTGKTVSGPLVHVFTFTSDAKLTHFEEFEPGGDDAW